MTFEELKAKYPDSMNLYCFSGVGDGWVTQIMDPLCEQLKDKPVRFSQIKEKFGGLRAYWDILEDARDTLTDEDWNFIADAVDKAEDKSWEVCHHCGSEEDVTTGGKGWAETLCKVCRNS